MKLYLVIYFLERLMNVCEVLWEVFLYLLEIYHISMFKYTVHPRTNSWILLIIEHNIDKNIIFVVDNLNI